MNEVIQLGKRELPPLSQSKEHQKWSSDLFVQSKQLIRKEISQREHWKKSNELPRTHHILKGIIQSKILQSKPAFTLKTMKQDRTTDIETKVRDVFLEEQEQSRNKKILFDITAIEGWNNNAEEKSLVQDKQHKSIKEQLKNKQKYQRSMNIYRRRIPSLDIEPINYSRHHLKQELRDLGSERQITEKQREMKRVMQSSTDRNKQIRNKYEKQKQIINQLMYGINLKMKQKNKPKIQKIKNKFRLSQLLL